MTWILHSLRGRLMLLMLVAALPAVAILLYATAWLRNDAIERNTQQVLAQARLLAARHQEHVDEIDRLLNALSQTPEAISPRRPACQAAIDRIRREASAYVENLIAIDADGVIQCTNTMESPLIRVSDRSYYRQALQVTGFAGGEYVISRFSNEPVFVFTHTVRREGERPVVLAAALKLSWLRAHPQLAELPPGSAYAIFDRQGTILLRHPDPEQRTGKSIATAPSWRIMSRLAGPATFREKGWDGSERLFGYAPLGPAEAPYARLSVSVPMQSLFAESERLFLFGLFAIAIACALGLLGGWLGSTALVLRPMRPIFETIRRVAAGDLEARTGSPPGKRNEIEQLAGEVDHMAQALATASREHRQSEQAARRERDRAQAYLDIVGVMIVALDEHGTVTLVNHKTCAVLGCARNNSCVGGNWFDEHIPPEQQDALRDIYRRLMSGELAAVEHHENEILTCAGERRLVAWHNTVLRDDGGRIVGTLSAGEDITRRRQLEEERERLRSQLQQAQKMEALGQLTGGIAHDFNNILASMLGFSKLALKRHVPDQDSTLAEYLREVIMAGERARDLIAKMMTFSRLRRNDDVQPLALAPLVRETLQMLASTIPASIRIESLFDDDLPDVAIAPVDMQQILINLVVNARDAMQGKGKIDVELRRMRVSQETCAACHQTISGDYVALSVADTGHGIPPGVLERIFDPFFTTKEVGKGTGMGLAVVHGLVFRSGRHVLVDSCVGAGTVFRILFPPAGDADAGRQTAAATAPLLPPASPASRRRVMVVDDEASIRRFVADALEAAGWAVSAFGDPLRALEAFRQAPADWSAVIADQTMPDLTGSELMAALRELRPELPIILCTGYSEQLDAAQAAQLGADGFFLKPVAPDDLIAALNSLADRRASRQ